MPINMGAYVMSQDEDIINFNVLPVVFTGTANASSNATVSLTPSETFAVATGDKLVIVSGDNRAVLTVGAFTEGESGTYALASDNAAFITGGTLTAVSETANVTAIGVTFAEKASYTLTIREW